MAGGNVLSKDKVQAPSAAVRLGGGDVSDALGLSVQKVTVKLSFYEASQAEILLWDCYDIVSHSLKAKLKEGLELGAGVEVDLGYQSGLSTVFYGYMESVSLNMTEEEAYVLSITAFDAIRLLKENVRCRIWKGTSHSSVVSEILEDYSWACAADVASTTELEAEEDWWQDGNDYDFIVNELARIHNPGCRFYMSGHTACFKEMKKEAAALVLEPDSGITDFHASWHYLNKKIRVHGLSQSHQAYLGEAEALGGHQSSSGGQWTSFSAMPQADTQDKADAAASCMAAMEKARAVDISLTIKGTPGLTPGKYLELSGMDSWVNGTYLIVEAEHVMDEEGYRTTVRLEGS